MSSGKTPTASRTIALSFMLKHAVVDAQDQPLGRLEDVIIRLQDKSYPLLIGLAVRLGKVRFFVPAQDIVSIDMKSHPAQKHPCRSAPL